MLPLCYKELEITKKNVYFYSVGKWYKMIIEAISIPMFSQDNHSIAFELDFLSFIDRKLNTIGFLQRLVGFQRST